MSYHECLKKWALKFSKIQYQYDGIHLLYVTAKEAQKIIEEVHESSYGQHMNAHMLSWKIMR